MAVAGNLRTIRRKIRSIENLKKITRAMQMVSAVKLKKNQARLWQIRPYSDKIAELLQELSAAQEQIRHPFFQPRQVVNAIGLVIISADKGLCGTYNVRIIDYALKFIQEKATPVQLVTIGKKCTDFFARRKYIIKASYTGIPTDIPFAQIQQMVGRLVEMFEKGSVDEIYFLFTKFINALTFKPSHFKFLPIVPPEKVRRHEEEYIFEPQPKIILDHLVPRYLETTFHRLLLESLSSEHAARMNAMRNATENAEELIAQLTIIRNKVRQTSITRELLDIVTGAEALKAR